MTGNGTNETATVSAGWTVAGRLRGLRAAGLSLVVLLLLVASGAPAAHADELENGREAAKKCDWPAAAQSFGLVLDKKPADREAALGLAEAAIKAGAKDYYALAEDALLVLRERNARDYEVLIALGRICLAIASTKSDTLALKSYNDEALKSFEAAARIQPSSEPATVGIARVHYESAFFDKAIEVVDTFLARKPEHQAEALFWKGQALYTLAGDTYGRVGSLTDEVKSLYTRAQGAYAASAAADPSAFQTQLQLAYASAWISDSNTALQAYLAAAVLDPKSRFPLKGIVALYTHDPAGLPKTLEALLADHPKHPQALWFLGFDRFMAKDWPAAITYLQRAADAMDQPGEPFYYLGQAYAASGDEKNSEAAYWKALEASPDNAQVAWALELLIQKSSPMERARESVKAANEVIAEYEKIIQKAPRNFNVRNNLAFTLREAYVANQASKAWIPILNASIKYYVAASELIGEYTADKQALNYPTRHAMAQVISDTGLMFQFYPPTQDYAKAIKYYNRALEFSEDGYWDAYNNLAQLFASEKRWIDLHDLALACAEGIKSPTGAPESRGRESAKATAAKLVSEGKVKE